MRLEDQFYYNSVTGECYFVVNIMADPSKVTNVQTYKKQPLSTVCFKVSERVMNKLIYIFNGDESSSINIPYIEQYCRKINLFSYLLMFLPFKAINQFSDAEEYRELVSKFIQNDYYSTYIFKFDISDEDFDRVYAHMVAAEAKESEDTNEDDSLYNYDQTIVIGAFPINGIMRPIQRSENYVIYNGCFIRCESYYYDDIYNMPYLYNSMNNRWSDSSNNKVNNEDFKEEEIKMGYLSYQYKMVAYSVINLYTTFSLFTVDRVSLTQGIITEHRLSGYYDEDITHDCTFPMYSQSSYVVPVTNEKIFTNAPGNLFPINDRPYYALPKAKKKPVKIEFGS
jgi:hypothetical protein